MNIAIYCASRLGNDELYKNASLELIEELARNNFNIVYGGSISGIMGEVSKKAMDLNMKVYGVMSKSLKDMEIINNDLTELFLVDTLKQRKDKMEELSDAFIALPGGIGTLDEIFEVIVLNQIGKFDKTCVFYNVNGYYDKLLEFLNDCSQKGFIQKEILDKIIVSNDEKEISKKLKLFESTKN